MRENKVNEPVSDMRKFLKFLIFVPIAIIVLLLAMANRTSTVFSLDPFTAGEPMLFLRAPLFVYLFAALIIGVLLGGFSAWLAQGRHRRIARQLKFETSRLKADIAARNRQPEGARGSAITVRQ